MKKVKHVCIILMIQKERGKSRGSQWAKSSLKAGVQGLGPERAHCPETGGEKQVGAGARGAPLAYFLLWTRLAHLPGGGLALE